ncbi:hypothetical protein R1sor_005574 [Riccia sorocarpa]|uniref:Uncharacterized protein n=1 Tax=Riccia sorocarpa TaxID=122646 RepID=A0ABD3HJW7_9MARC
MNPRPSLPLISISPVRSHAMQGRIEAQERVWRTTGNSRVPPLTGAPVEDSGGLGRDGRSERGWYWLCRLWSLGPAERVLAVV